MIVERIRLRSFRNHRDSELEFGPGVNLLLGNNGEGKTNIVEGMSYLCLTKSFYAASDATTVQMGTDGFEIEGDVLTGSDRRSVVRVVYNNLTGDKQISINKAKPDTLASVIGRFPMVILSPENGVITSGGPNERRKFIDLLLSQISSVYFEDILEYRRILRQRNKILADHKFHGTRIGETLDPWNTSLVNYGSRIIHRRRQFVDEFQEYVGRAYQSLVGTQEIPRVTYCAAQGLADGHDVDGIAERMTAVLAEYRAEEYRRGLTLVGPHRDDLLLEINGVSVHKYASQGQHKTMLVALKIAEFFYMKEARSETPVVLLDDVFSELDDERSRHIIALTGTLGQTVITATAENMFRDITDWNGPHRRFIVEQGTCRPS